MVLKNTLFLIGLMVAAIGAVSGAISVGAELVSQEPVFLIAMKISSILFGSGGIIMAVSSRLKEKEEEENE